MPCHVTVLTNVGRKLQGETSKIIVRNAPRDLLSVRYANMRESKMILSSIRTKPYRLKDFDHRIPLLLSASVEMS